VPKPDPLLTKVNSSNKTPPVSKEDKSFVPSLHSVPLESDPIFSTNDKMNKVKNLIN